MPGRNGNSNEYRFGVQGWEKDDEITGVVGSHYTTYFREFDTRLNRTWSRDPKNQYASPYVVLGNNPMNGVDPDGAWFWEKKNVRQARKFARKTGGEFEKWKTNGKRYASVTFTGEEKNKRKSTSASKSIDGARVGSYVFKEGQDRSDLLKKTGTGTFERWMTQKSGWNYLYWTTIKRGEAWASGWYEYNRHGQAPAFIKGVVGLIPLISVPNAIKILAEEEDIYGIKASTKTDKVVAGIEIVTAGFLPIGKAVKPVIGTVKAVTIAERTNQVMQFTNDLGGLDKLKKLENKNE